MHPARQPDVPVRLDCCDCLAFLEDYIGPFVRLAFQPPNPVRECCEIHHLHRDGRIDDVRVRNSPGHLCDGGPVKHIHIVIEPTRTTSVRLALNAFAMGLSRKKAVKSNASSVQPSHEAMEACHCF